MENIAVEILKTFSKDELSNFREFLSSPFFNKSQKLINFFNELIKYYPTFDSKKLTNESLCKNLSSSVEFNQMTFNNLVFDLSTTLKAYLKTLCLEKYRIESNDLFTRELMSRKLFKLAKENNKQMINECTSKPNVDANYYVNMFYLLTDKLNLNKITKPKSNDENVKLTVNTLIDRGKFITFFFLTEMVREYENILTLGKVYDTMPENNFILDFISKTDFLSMIKIVIENEKDKQQCEILKIYYELLLALSNFDNEEYYYRYKTTLLRNVSILSINEKRFHFGRLLRYCLTKNQNHQGNNKFGEELFKIYEYILKNENYVSSITNNMPVELFRDILLHGLRLRKYNWVISFIKKYIKCLNPDRRQNIFHYSLAEYYFNIKKFHKAKQFLSKIIFEEFIYKLDYRNLFLMIHFELEEYESALSLIDSYIHFLRNDKTFSSDYKKRNKKFIKIVNKLILHKTSPNRLTSGFIFIDYNQDYPYKEWINEKVREVEWKIQKAV
ncbi:MAG TPA: hypothetical protein PKA90_13620 [Ignavibacteria bacterium]|nr:hypothetical protein [Ignavibacteria bacterium]HMR41458.1 hypothetical protein [Ignavibacteria bacterium]